MTLTAICSLESESRKFFMNSRSDLAQASLNNANALSWLSSLKSENESKFVNKSQSSTWCST